MATKDGLFITLRNQSSVTYLTSSNSFSRVSTSCGSEMLEPTIATVVGGILVDDMIFDAVAHTKDQAFSQKVVLLDPNNFYRWRGRRDTVL
jgi:hypothetical protein